MIVLYTLLTTTYKIEGEPPDNAGKVKHVLTEPGGIVYVEGGYNHSASRKPLGKSISNITLSLDQFLATDVNTTSIVTLVERLAWMLSTPTVRCHKTLNLGGQSYCVRKQLAWDGYKSVCLDERVRPQPRRCIALSFGVGNEYSFDNAIAKYGCKVFSFDFTMLNMTHSCYRPNQHYLDAALSHVTVNEVINAVYDHSTHPFQIRATAMTLKRVLEVLDLSPARIDYLKIDIEGGEWGVLRQILFQNEYILVGVKQIILEIHLHFMTRFKENFDESSDATIDVFEMFQKLLKTGFRLANWIPNAQTMSFVDFNDISIAVYKELHFINTLI